VRGEMGRLEPAILSTPGMGWGGTLGSPKGSHGRGPEPPMEGEENPWEPKESHGRGPLGSPLGAHLKVFCDEVTFQK